MRVLSIFVVLCVVSTSHFPWCSGKALKFDENGKIIRSLSMDKMHKDYVNLKHLLDKFMALVDKDEISEFIAEKLATDPDAQAIYEYLFEEDAKAIVEFLWDQTSYAELIEWMYYNGLTNIYNELNELHTFFGWTTVQVPDKIQIKSMENLSKNIPKSLGSLLEEFLDELPVNLISNLAYELFQNNDPAFMAIVNKLKTPEIGTLWREFKSLPEVERLKQTLEDGGIDLELFLALLEAFFGWGRLLFY